MSCKVDRLFGVKWSKEIGQGDTYLVVAQIQNCGKIGGMRMKKPISAKARNVRKIPSFWGPWYWRVFLGGLISRNFFGLQNSFSPGPVSTVVVQIELPPSNIANLYG